MSDYTSTAKVKVFLDITDANRDSKFAAIIPSVTADIDKYTGRTFDNKTLTDVYMTSESGMKYLFPKYFPIISVTSISENGILLTENVDYWMHENYIERAGEWSDYPKGIKITYVAGFAAVPADIEQAANELVAIRSGEKTKTFTTNEGIEQTVLITSIPQYVKDLLDKYKVRNVG